MGGLSSKALDFQVHSTEIVDDGIKKQQTYFGEGNKTIIYVSLPTDWTYTADPSSLRLVSPSNSGSTIRLQISPFLPDLPFKDQGLATYQKQALTLVPSGATSVQIAEQHDNPLPIMHWQSHEFILSYDFFGQAFRISVLFLNVNAKQQILAAATAIKSEFDATRTVGFDVLRSWQPMPAN